MRVLVIEDDDELAEAIAAGLAERLVANLVDNAIRYNTTGGQVEIGTGTRAGRAHLTVTNTGPVIPPDQLGRLFQPFQRMDPARRSPGGLGLGLAIVSAIAAAHRADLRAVTRAAGGLAIEVLFPPVPQSAAADPPARGERIPVPV